VRFAAAIAELFYKLKILIKNQDRRFQAVGHIKVAPVIGYDSPRRSPDGRSRIIFLAV
jgi:hypothetical protein